MTNLDCTVTDYQQVRPFFRVQNLYFSNCRPLVKKCGLLRNVPGPGTKKSGPLVKKSGPFVKKSGPLVKKSGPLFLQNKLVLLFHLTPGRICNPTALSIRTCSPIIALQMLILGAAGLQIRPSVRLHRCNQTVHRCNQTAPRCNQNETRVTV